MESATIAKRLVWYISPTLQHKESDNTLLQRERYILWDLIKSDLRKEEQALLERLETIPFNPHVTEAVVDLLTIELHQNSELCSELSYYLEQAQELLYELRREQEVNLPKSLFPIRLQLI